MRRPNSPSEGLSNKNRTLLAILAFLGVLGYGNVASDINSGLEKRARTEAEGKIDKTRDRLHAVLGKFSLRNNPGIDRAKCNIVQTIELDGKKCELAVDDNSVYFLFIEGEEAPYFIGADNKATAVISTLKNLFAQTKGREDIKVVLGGL